ncbi:multiubiquitin domain-containing protein [Phenylobacterium sp. Root700]|uniref:multiubiquitin domain-containing protein n=1 Tax=Phenylobacterium sp. Root700 TaxID=1736591 RepID=UPI00190FFF10|nr:multiubiquitin domain-containing protein [Phenylobacterium sp. Root700]
MPDELARHRLASEANMEDVEKIEGGKDKDPKPPKTYEIKVNSRPKTVTEKKQSYRDIARLAYPDADFEKFLYTIVYLKGEGGKEGDLVEGETVNVKDGMVFNVRRSDKS